MPKIVLETSSSIKPVQRDAASRRLGVNRMRPVDSPVSRWIVAKGFGRFNAGPGPKPRHDPRWRCAESIGTRERCQLCDSAQVEDDADPDGPWKVVGDYVAD